MNEDAMTEQEALGIALEALHSYAIRMGEVKREQLYALDEPIKQAQNKVYAAMRIIEAMINEDQP
jgi:hypothetical protein